jgi:hypothetical protein
MPVVPQVAREREGLGLREADRPFPVCFRIVEDERDACDIVSPAYQIPQSLAPFGIDLTQSDGDGQQNRGFARAVGAGNQIEPGLERDARVLIGHEVLQDDLLQPDARSGFPGRCCGHMMHVISCTM